MLIHEAALSVFRLNASSLSVSYQQLSVFCVLLVPAVNCYQSTSLRDAAFEYVVDLVWSLQQELTKGHGWFYRKVRNFCRALLPSRRNISAYFFFYDCSLNHWALHGLCCLAWKRSQALQIIPQLRDLLLPAKQ